MSASYSEPASRLAEPIAIVGMDVLLPGAPTVEDYWNNLINGVDCISDVPENRWEPEWYDPERAEAPNRVYCKRGGFLDELAYFEPLRFGVMPASVPETEPEQLLALRVAAGAIEDAGGMDKLADRNRVGVILGRLGQSTMTSMKFYLRVMLGDQMVGYLRELMPELGDDRLELIRERITQRMGPYHPENVIGLMPNLTASRVANRLDLGGPAYILDGACASSLLAVEQGIAELEAGRLDAVIAGGVQHNHDITFWAVFSQLRALSKKQQIRPFDAAADGLLIGEGSGAVLLKRLSDAVRDGDRIHAVIRGIGTSSDGKSASLVNPETTGQVLAVRRAWASAGLDPADPDSVGMVEAHGTSTPVGDATELTTLATVFGQQRGSVAPVIGSVKSMIGHAIATAGMASLVKSVLAVSRGMLLPTLHCDNPRAEMARTRFVPIATARPWDDALPRRAAVNAFGFGGINAHVIIEPAPDVARPRRGHSGSRPVAAPARQAAAAVYEPDKIVLLAGQDAAALARLLDADDHVIRMYGTSAASTPAIPGGGSRIGIADPTPERLAAARKVVKAGAAWRGGRDIWFSPRPMLADGKGKIAFLFPGLEAELTHTVDDVAAHFGFAAPDIDEADFASRFTGVIGLSWLLHESLLKMNIKPDAVAGHSLGEWTAQLVAGMVEEAILDEASTMLINPAWERAELLHAVIGDSAETVAGLLPGYPGVCMSHDNAPAQSVVCGPVEQVNRLISDLSQRSVLCRPLPFTTGIHTPHVAPQVEQMRPAVEELRRKSKELAVARAAAGPPTPVWSATIAAPFPDDEDGVLELFLRQLRETVQWRSTLLAMHDAGFRAFLQVGPGQLASLVHDNLRDRDHLAIPVNVAFRSGMTQLQRVATALWVEGYAADFAALAPRVAEQEQQAAKPAPRKRSMPPVLLELGTERITLGDGADEFVTVRRPHSAGSGSIAQLSQLGGSSAAAAELAALLEETADAAVAVLSAASQAGPAQSAAPAWQPAPPAPAAYPAPAGNGHPGNGHAGNGHGGNGHAGNGHAASAQPPAPAPAAPPAAAPPAATAAPAAAADSEEPWYTAVIRSASEGGELLHSKKLRVSLADMPYLIDHAFNPQPPNWPNLADLNSVVAAMTIITHMVEATEEALPGQVATRVEDCRFRTWALTEPPQDVEVIVREVEPGKYTAGFGYFARATVYTAPQYPEPPEVWPVDPMIERPSLLSVADLYGKRVMFHGPQYQAVEEVYAVGERHARGLLRTPAPPGALLDGALQLLGNWAEGVITERKTMFPTAFGSIRFYGPHPATGSPVDVHAKVHTLTDKEMIGTFQYVQDGRVWAEVVDCTTRRFDSHPRSRAAETLPGRKAWAIRQPEGWVASFDYWPDPTSQNSIVSLVLGAAGWLEYDAQPIARRKGWILGRLAIKDAIRFQLWDAEPERSVFPIEVGIREDGGRTEVYGWDELTIPPVQVSWAPGRHVAVAMTRPAGEPAPGIGVAELGKYPRLTPPAPLTEAESAVLAAAAAGGSAAGNGTDDASVWAARFEAAKDAAARAHGTAPDAEIVTAAGPDAITVTGAGHASQVSYRELQTPPDLTSRRYIVAWTS